MTSNSPPPRDPSEEKADGEGAKSGEWTETAVLLARVSGIGWFMAASIAVGALGGHWLDGRFGTSPVLAAIGVLLGSIIAFVGMLRILRYVSRSGAGKR